MPVKPEHLGADRWRIRVWDGKRQRTVTFRAQGARAANRQAAKHETRLREEIQAGRDRRATVAGLVDDWQKHRDRLDSPTTARKRRATINRIRDDLGAIPLEQLTAEHVDNWLADLKAAGLTDTTIGNHWSTLRSILRQGKRWRRVSASVLDAYTDAEHPSRIGNRRPAPPTAAALRVLLEQASPTLRVAASLAAYAGLRRGEICGLVWGDVNWRAHTIHVQRAMVERDGGGYGFKPPKSGVDRVVHIGQGLVAVLREHWVACGRDGGPVVRDFITGEPWKLMRLTRRWAAHCERHGAPGLHLHDLRHFYATDALAAGVPPALVQQQLGHSQQSTTLNVYGSHVQDGAMRAAVELLDERWGLPSGR